MILLATNIKYIKWLGLWFDNSDLMYKIYRAAIILLVTVFTASEITFIYVHRRDHTEAMKAFNVLTFHLNGIFKLACWWVFFRQIKQLICNDLNNAENSVLNSTREVVRANRIATIYHWFIIVSINIVCVFTYFRAYFYAPSVGDGNVNSRVRKQLPYSSWFPFDYLESEKVFVITFVLQYLNISLFAHFIAAMHTIFACVMIVIAGQLKAINLGFSLEFSNKEISKLTQAELMAKLKIYIKQLQDVLHFASRVKPIISVCLFGHLLTAFTVCSCLLLLTKEPLLESISTLIFGVTLTFDLFTFCYFGNEVTYQCDKVRDAVGRIHWINSNVDFKKSIILTYIRLQKPIILKIGGLIPISLNMFIMFLRSTYSLFTLFQEITN